MKKTDFFAKLSELTKIDVETLTKAIASETEEVEVEFPEVHTFTQEELNTRDLNSSRKGNHTAVEMAVKEARNKLVEQYGEEANFQGKTMDNLLETALKVGEKKAGVKPNDQLIEKDKVIAALQKTNQQLESERDLALQDKDKFQFNYEVDSTLIKKVPNVENATFSPDEYIALWKRDKEIVTVDGIKTFKINGEVARDTKTQNPISIESDFENFLTQKGVKQVDRKGRGEGDKNIPYKTGTIDGVKTTVDFEKYCEENKITSLDGKKAALMEVMKKTPEFIHGQS
jgi:hypothetical protein